MAPPKSSSATASGAKSRRAKAPKSTQAVDPIMTPKDATVLEKHFLWLWARYLHSNESIGHPDLARTLGITVAVSSYRLTKIKELVAAMQHRAQIEIQQEKDKAAEEALKGPFNLAEALIAAEEATPEPAEEHNENEVFEDVDLSELDLYQ